MSNSVWVFNGPLRPFPWFPSNKSNCTVCCCGCLPWAGEGSCLHRTEQPPKHEKYIYAWNLWSSFVLQKSENRQPVDGAQSVFMQLLTVTFDHFSTLCLWDRLTPRRLQKKRLYPKGHSFLLTTESHPIFTVAKINKNPGQRLPFYSWTRPLPPPLPINNVVSRNVCNVGTLP